AAGGVEQKSPLVESVLAPLFDGRGDERGEGTAVLLLEADVGQRAIAEVAWSSGWRGDGREALAACPPPTDPARALVAMAREHLVDLGAWRGVARGIATAAGGHEAAGGFAAAAAIGAIASGDVD